MKLITKTKQLTFLFVFFMLLSTNSYANEKHPVIFVHGIIVPSSVYTDIVPIEDVISENGFEGHVAVRPSGLITEERAAVLRDEINRLVPEGKFHIIGHSAGGIDARYLVHKYPDMAKRCLSITTMATPHRGSPIADEILKGVNQNKLGLDTLMYKFLYSAFENGRQLTVEMTTDYMKEFNKKVTMVKGIKYFSIAWFIQEPFYMYTRPYIWNNFIKMKRLKIDETDGTVPVKSAKYGTHIGTFPGDHLSETSPIPYGGKEIYKNNFKIVLENIDSHFYQD